MTHESKDDAFLEKVILFLVVLVGAVLVFNQFQFAKLSSNIFLNAVSFLFIFFLIGLIIWLFIQKKPHAEKQLSAHEHHEIKHHKIEHEKKPLSFMEKLSWGFVALIAVLILFNQFQISQVNAVAFGTSSTGRFARWRRKISKRSPPTY